MSKLGSIKIRSLDKSERLRLVTLDHHPVELALSIGQATLFTKKEISFF